MGDLHRVLGTHHVAAVAVGALLGGGLLSVPRRVENLAGPTTPVAYLLAAFGGVALALCLAVFLAGPTGDRAGTVYAALDRTWDSRPLAFAVVWTTPAAYVALLALLAAWLGDWLARAVPLGVAPRLWAVALLAGLTALHLLGPRWPARLQVVVTGGVALFALAVVVPGLAAVVPGNFVPPFPTESLRADPVGAVGDATLVALFGVVGLDVVAALGGETRDARRVLPRAVLAATAAVGVLVALAALVVLGVIPWTRLVFAPVPLADAAASYLGVRAATLAGPGTLAATLSAFLALGWAPSRLLYALGDVVPPLARTNRRGAPDVAVLATTGTAAALVWADAVGPALYLVLPGLFGLYACVALSAAALPRADREGFDAAGVPLRPAALAATGLAAAGLCSLCLALVVTRDPVATLGWLRHAPALSLVPDAVLVQAPTATVVPATFAWLTVGGLVWIVARDYRASLAEESADGAE
jgi:amino acid transporter